MGRGPARGQAAVLVQEPSLRPSTWVTGPVGRVQGALFQPWLTTQKPLGSLGARMCWAGQGEKTVWIPGD